MAIGDLIVGIDIGTSRVCCCLGQINKFNQVEILNSASCECDGFKKGKYESTDAIARAIRFAISDIEEQYDFVIKSAYVNIIGKYVDVYNTKYSVELEDKYAGVSQENINDLIKGWKKKLAEEKEVRNPDDRTRSRIAKWQRSIERDRKTLHNYDDPDWVNFSFGNPLSVSRSRDGAQISGITLLMSRSGSVWNRSIYFKAVNSGSGGGSFTGEDPRGEHGRVSVKLPLGGGSGSLSYDGREYDVFEYDEETYDKYIKMTR